MHNALYEPLPMDYEGHRLDTSYQTAIQIQALLDDETLADHEALELSVDYLFGDDAPPCDIWIDSLVWWLNGWNHDNPVSSDGYISSDPVMDYGIDQWRIISAFKTQYNIDLLDPDLDLHWWVFAGLLNTLDECAFTRVCDIRTQKIDSKMDAKEASRLRKLKSSYRIEKESTRRAIEEEKARINAILNGED